MRVEVEKRYIDSYKNIAKDANKAIKKKTKFKAPKEKYEKILLTKNISVEAKKKKLAKCLYELIVQTYSIETHNLNEHTIGRLKENIQAMRDIIRKIKDINNYLEGSFLKELGIIKKSLILQAVNSRKPEKYLQEQRGLPKDYIEKIEHAVFELMHEIVFFDEKLIKNYHRKEVKVITEEKLEIKDLERILVTESELLDALEAKSPPPSQIKPKLFKKEMFNKRIPIR